MPSLAARFCASALISFLSFSGIVVRFTALGASDWATRSLVDRNGVDRSEIVVSGLFRQPG
jgi:hypothetical protein